MATTFDENERSTAQSRPIDLYTITTPTVTYRLTSYPVDVVYAGNTFTATTMDRGTQQIAQDMTGREFVLRLAITHPLVQRYAAYGTPEREVVVEHLRLQEVSGVAVRQWVGFANALTVEGSGDGKYIASLRVPSIIDDAMKVRLPVIGAQPLCNHVLYDTQCQVDRNTASSNMYISAIAGNTVTVTFPLAGNGMVYGDIVHTPTSERRMVIAQSGSVLTINVPFVGAAAGDAVEISPGCDHTLVTCRDKFGNVINFGGHPELNATVDPWAPKGQGVIQQT